MKSSTFYRRVQCLALLLAGLVTRHAQASDPTDTAAAEALFARGKELLAAGDYSHACPKFDESYRLDPATGALYALALCHEAQGKLASAWAEFMDAAARSNTERNTEREQSARHHAQLLEPRLSFLTVNVTPDVAALSGLVVTRDGTPLRRPAWGTAIPVDPGPHVVRAEATGHEPWSKSLSVQGDAQQALIEVPKLSLVAKPTQAEAPNATPASGFLGERPLRTIGIGLGAAGATALVLAGVATWRASENKSEAADHCPQNQCDSQGVQHRAAALEAADFATASAIVGGVLLAAGASLFIYDLSAARENTQPRMALSIRPTGVDYMLKF